MIVPARKDYKNYFIVLTGLFVSVGLVLSACSPASSSSKEKLKMAPMAGMPAEVQSAPATVQAAYQFAAANPEVLKNLPCYCGCGQMGHTSNYSCYVQSDDNGEVIYDTHALGCGICVDITQDAMRMMREGRSVQEIRAEIDADFSRFGPSNMP